MKNFEESYLPPPTRLEEENVPTTTKPSKSIDTKKPLCLIKSSYLGLRRLKKRYLIIMMCMMMNALSYTIRTNINITIVTMVLDDNTGRNHSSDNCPSSQLDVINDSNQFHFKPSSNESTSFGFFQNNIYEETRNPEKSSLELFNWSESLQGTILGAFYYGYILTNFNGGQLSEWIGTRRLLTISMAISAVLTLLVPAASFCHPWLLIIVRILTGLAQGVVTPAIYQLLSYWVPRNELGLAFGLIPASGYIGAVITMPVCAFLSKYGFFGGWPSVFYVFGFTGLLCLIPWLILVYDSPDYHPKISEDELRYIRLNSMAQKQEQSKESSNGRANTWVPWCSIISSIKIWAITLSKFCTAWGNLFLMSKLPTYLSQVLNMPITYNSYVNASIYISLGGSLLSWGSVADWVERRQCLSRTTSRKLFQTIALVGSAAFLASIPLFGCDIIPIIIMLNLSMITLGLTAGGDSLIVVDIAPDYSGSLYGFSNSIASLPGFLAPLFVGLMLDQPNTNEMQQWSLLFWIGASIYVFGALVFLLFVDSKPESWGRQQHNSSIVSLSKCRKQADEADVINYSQHSANKDLLKLNSSKHEEQEYQKRSDSRLSESDPLSNTSTSCSTTSSGSIPTRNFASTTTTTIIVEPNPINNLQSEKDNSSVFSIKV